jgi:hypothetical protein
MSSIPTRLVAVFACATLLGTGCLGNTYRISHGSLMQLSQTPPEARGQNVRVVQSFAGSDDPPAATAVDGSTQVEIGGGVHVGPDHHHHHQGGPGSTGGGVSSGGSSAHPNTNVPSAKAAADDSRVWIIAAIALAVGLAATEGARFDGWVRLHPMHPVHLYGPYGEYSVVPLAQLTPEMAAWSRRAVIRESEGPFTRLVRAPLNRVGWTYGVTVGSSVIPSVSGAEEAGFMSHISFGAWPAQQVGLLLDVGLGWRENELGNVVFDGRYALELDFMPVSAGVLHLGGFGQVGIATRVEDGNPVTGGPNGDTGGRLFGAGAQAQLEITTRLAVTARAGMTWIHDERVPEFQLGLSIY